MTAAPDGSPEALPVLQRIGAAAGGMVATQHWMATEAGVECLRAGGNAFDAAAAAALALGVCEPAASGLGGQSLALVHLASERRTFALDGSSRAPNRTLPDSVPRAEQLRGHRATTVPSTPATLAWMVRTFGRLDWARVVEPSIRLAEEGCPVTALQRRLTIREVEHLRVGSAARFFLAPSGEPLPVGAVLRQPVLGETLRRLAEHGVEDFYQGGIAERIHADMQAHGGLLHADDLAQIPWPIERRPVGARVLGHRVLTFPPPGAGRTLLQILQLWEELPERWRDLDALQGAVAFAEVVRRANLDRRDRPFDPNLYPQVEDKRLLSQDYLRGVAKQVRKRTQLRGETTHLSVADADGNFVALTQSIERVYGSFEAAPDLGFLYNNYLSAFEYDDPSHPHFLRPNTAPWASVAPTIVFRGRKPWCALGSPGSARIASSVAQVLLRMMDGEPVMAAVTAPRLHCTEKGEVRFEAPRMRSDLAPALERRKFSVRPMDAFEFHLGCVQVVVAEKDGFVGVADLRRDGSAAGAGRSRAPKAE